MRRLFRGLADKVFTSLSGLAVLLMTAALLIILGPMIYRGATAVVFRGTVEFRKMQLREEKFSRGDREAVEAEEKQINLYRQPVYDILDGPFNDVIDPERLLQKVRRDVYRQLRRDLSNRVQAGTLKAETRDEMVSEARKLRRYLEAAYEATTTPEAIEHLDKVLKYDKKKLFADTRGTRFFTMAAEYRSQIEQVDLSRREQYKQQLKEVKAKLVQLLGPRPGQKAEAELAMFRYGATRWDRTQKLLHELLYQEKRVYEEKGGWGTKVYVSRRETFKGTPIEKLLTLVERDIEKMMDPRWTFYWQYFIDDWTSSHFYGGVGAEILGTLSLTLLTMVFAVPVGVITAAYLAECAGDNYFVRFVRMCINTLAGVPSIVFGLFGLALFLGVIQPMLFGTSKRSIFAGAMTLGVLVLPIMIRASEEAIRAVPASYKEASLSLGAGGFRTFLTVTFPAALPGILTGIILSMSRAAGEVAPLLFTAAVATQSEFFPNSLVEGGVRTLSYGSHQIATADNIGPMVPHQQYGMIMTLILLVLILNITAIVIRSRMSRKLRGQ